MHEKYLESLEQIVSWSTSDQNIQGAIVLGSQVRDEFPGDEYSDLDLLLFVDDPSSLIADKTWLANFGIVVATGEETVELDSVQLTWHVIRVLYPDNRALDFSIIPNSKLDTALSINSEIHAAGCSVIYDSTGRSLTTKIEKSLDSVGNERVGSALSKTELDSLVSNLLFQIIWSRKKIIKAELWVAVAQINSFINNLLLQLIELHNRYVSKKSSMLMYEGRMLEQRTDRVILDKLPNCFAKYDSTDATETLGSLIEFVYSVSKEIYSANDLSFDELQFTGTRNLFNEMLG